MCYDSLREKKYIVFYYDRLILHRLRIPKEQKYVKGCFLLNIGKLLINVFTVN